MAIGCGKVKRIGILLLLLAVLGSLIVATVVCVRRVSSGLEEVRYEIGDAVGELNGVKIYYNGQVSGTNGRSLAPDGYNLGLRYQCVEFVKRYYYERLGHRMPDTWGHAKDFYDPTVADGEMNATRGLRQFRNGGAGKPEADDLMVFGPTDSNPYGHVAIVSKVEGGEVEIAQQNPGPKGKARVVIGLRSEDGAWRVMSDRALGWLRVSEGGG